MTDSLGYVFEKGDAGKKVLPKLTIYASPICKTVIRHGEGIKGGVDYYNWHEEEKWYPNDGTITQHEKPHEVSQADEEQKTRLQKLNEAADKIEELQHPTGAQSMTQWFDDIEAYIDALPTMSENGQIVYEVIYREDDWYYTGNYQEMDPEWNAKIQKAKAKVCAKLNDLAQTVTDKMISTLESLSDKTVKVGPIMKIIQVITSMSISLTSIIDWAMSVIDFFVQIFKMVMAYYNMIMSILEMCIVRFPQLLNKLMSKVTAFDCQVKPTVRAIKVNVKFEEKSSKDDSKKN